MKLVFTFLVIILAVNAGITSGQLQQMIRDSVNSPFVNVMFIYDSASQNGPLLERAMADVAQKKQGYMKILPIDCNTDDQDVTKNFPYCEKKVRSRLPALIYTEPVLNPINPEAGETPKNHQFQGQLSEKALFDFAIPLMKLYSIGLTKSSDWQKFKESYPNTPKIIYFTDKDKIQPFFKTLTAHFRNTIAFAHVFKNSSLCEELGVTSFPTLLLDGRERIQLTSNLLDQVELLKQYEGEPTNIIIQEFQESQAELNSDNFEEKVLNNPRHILIHIPTADGTPHPEWKKSQQSFKKMFDYYDGSQLVSELGVKHRPAIVYYPKSLTKKQLKKTIFYANNNFRNIYDEISSLIQDFTVALSSDIEMQKLTSIPLNEGRFVAVLFHKDQISLSYRVLSNDERFKQGLDFFRMKDPDAEVISKFNLKKLPSLLVMIVDDQNKTKPVDQEEKQGRQGLNLRVAHYSGKFNYDQLEKYLSYFVERPKKETETNTPQLKEIRSRKSYESQCLQQGCYLLLIDGNEEKKQANAEFINILKKSASKTYQNVGYLDGKCHSEVLSKLEIYAQDLPALIYLNTKFQKYSRLIGRIEEKSIESFFLKVSGNKGIWRAYDSFVFENKDCAKQHQKLKELEESGYQLSEEQAEILQQIRQQQERKKQQASKGEDKDSKKKRRKRRPKEQDSEL